MKRIVIVCCALLGLTVSVVAVLLATFDPNSYKPQFIELVERRTGRHFDIKGEIFLKLSLVPTFAVEHVTFGNAAWAAHETMATVERFEAHARLLPLLRGRVEINDLLLIAPHVTLEHSKKGIGNWILTSGEENAAAAPTAIPSFDLAKVTIRAAVFEYRNAKGRQHEVKIDHISLLRTRFGQPLALEIQADYDGIPVELAGRIAPLSRWVADEPYAVNLLGRIGEVGVGINGGLGKPLSGEGLRLDVNIAADSLARLGELLDLAWPPAGPVSVNLKLTGQKGEYHVRDLDLKLGQSDLAGEADITLTRDIPRMTARLRSARVDLPELTGPRGAAQTADGGRIFSLALLPVAGLQGLEADIDLAIARLLTDVAELTEVVAKLELRGGRVVVKPFRGGSAGGRIDGALTFDGSSDVPTLTARLTVKDVAVAELTAVAAGKLVTGGRGDFDIDIKGAGRSVAAIMGRANGRIRVDIRNARLHNKLVGMAGGDLLMRSISMLNPLSPTDDTTVLECAVINFPIRNGRAENKTGVGIRTDKLTILGGGSIDLETEAIDIGASPKPREGVGLNLSSLSDFVRLGGTLGKPQPVTDGAGAATAGFKIGAAVATGGLSLLVEGVFDRATSNVDVCRVAAGEVRLAAGGSAENARAPSATESAQNALKDAGSKVKDVFRGLFGD